MLRQCEAWQSSQVQEYKYWRSWGIWYKSTNTDAAGGAEKAIVHCDLKPENIMLKSIASPQIKVCEYVVN